MREFIVWVLLAGVNFGWQYFGTGNWDAAFERSLFQGGAIVALTIARSLWSLQGMR